MKNKEFKTPDQLLNFVLTECADIEYVWTDKLQRLKTTSDSDLLLKYVCYANDLLIEHFDYTIKILIISDNYDEVEENYNGKDSFNITLQDGYLDKLTITALDVYGLNLDKLPELPDTLEYLVCSENNLTKLPRLPMSLNKIECWDNPGYDKWCKDTRYEELIKISEGSVMADMMDRLHTFK